MSNGPTAACTGLIVHPTEAAAGHFLSAMGLAWMVMLFRVMSVTGRLFLPFTGTFSIESSVSMPSITLPAGHSGSNTGPGTGDGDQNGGVSSSGCRVRRCGIQPVRASVAASCMRAQYRTYVPNTGYTLFKCVALAYVMKNCEPLVLGPLLAIDTTPRWLCCGGAWRARDNGTGGREHTTHCECGEHGNTHSLQDVGAIA